MRYPRVLHEQDIHTGVPRPLVPIHRGFGYDAYVQTRRPVERSQARDSTWRNSMHSIIADCIRTVLEVLHAKATALPACPLQSADSSQRVSSVNRRVISRPIRRSSTRWL